MNDMGGVFQEDEAGSYHVSDAEDFAIETAALAIDPGPAAGDADILAREARMDAIHSSRPGGWIEQPDVPLMHVQAGEPAVSGAGSQDGAGVGVPLDGADWLVAEDEVCE